MFVVDTNILLYAADGDAPEHASCRAALEEWRRLPTPWHLTWGIVYEFLWLVTHPRVFRRPLSAAEALAFLEPILESEVVSVLVPSDRHEQLLRTTVGELGRPTGNLFHDLHTAVLMREHGIGRIATADSDFRKFPFLEVINPILPER